MKKKEELNIRGDSQYENEVHFFTYAAHKINNMALAITDKSAKFLYTTDSNDRGMIGAKNIFMSAISYSVNMVEKSTDWEWIYFV
jgi:hypothetical protein